LIENEQIVRLSVRLSTISPGEVSNGGVSGLEVLLANSWDAFDGSNQGGMEPNKLIGCQTALKIGWVVVHNQDLCHRVRVSKSDGSQTLGRQRDAVYAIGMPERNIYSDTASGERGDRPGSEGHAARDRARAPEKRKRSSPLP